MDKFVVREAIQSDKNFIFSSWLKGLYFGYDNSEAVEKIKRLTNNFEYVQDPLIREENQRAIKSTRSDLYGEIPAKIFFRNYQLVIERILAKPTTQVTVACLPDAADVVLGYSVYENDVLHWVFVKGSWRGLGVARAVIPIFPSTCTHLTRAGRHLKNKYAIVFNPFLL